MSKVKYVIEMDEDEYKKVKNAECSYDGFEKGTFGYYLDIIQKTATPITESDDAVSREVFLKKLQKEINIESKIVQEQLAKKEPIGTVKDNGRLGRLQGLNWCKNLINSLPPVLLKRE